MGMIVIKPAAGINRRPTGKLAENWTFVLMSYARRFLWKYLL